MAYPSVVYFTGCVNGNEKGNSDTAWGHPFTGPKAYHVGNGKYYATLYRPGNANGSGGGCGGGRFAVYFRDSDGSAKVLCGASDQKLSADGTALTLSIYPANQQKSIGLPGDEREAALFNVEIDLAANTVRVLPDDSKPRTLYVLHNPNCVGRNVTVGYESNYWDKYGAYGNYNESLFETSAGSGIYVGKEIWLAQEAVRDAEGNITSYRDCYFKVSATPGWATTDGNGTDVSVQTIIGQNLYCPPTVGTNIVLKSGETTAIGNITDGTNSSNVFVYTKPGCYKITVNTNDNTIKLEEKTVDNLFLIGAVNDMAWANALSGKKCDTDNGKFYATVWRSAETWGTFCFTTKNNQTGAYEGDVVYGHRYGGSAYVENVNAGSSYLFENDATCQQTSYKVNNGSQKVAYATINPSAKTIAFSDTPNLMYISVGGTLHKMNGGNGKWTISGVDLNSKSVHFCTMSGDPTHDTFGPNSNTAYVVGKKVQMTAHTAAGNYTFGDFGISNYEVTVTLENGQYYVNISPDKLYLVGNDDYWTGAKGKDAWKYDSSRPLTRNADGTYSATHVYLPGELLTPHSYFWFTTAPDGGFDRAKKAMLVPQNGADYHLGKHINEPTGVKWVTNTWSGSFIVTPGHYDININLETGKMSMNRTEPELMLIGNVNGQHWGGGFTEKMHNNGSGRYYATIYDQNNNNFRDKQFTFIDAQGHRYAGPKENYDLKADSVAAHFPYVFSEQTQRLAAGKSYWGSYSVNKDSEGLNSNVLYAACDLFTRQVRFYDKPQYMAIVVNGKVISLWKEGDKFFLPAVDIDGPFYFSTMPDCGHSNAMYIFGASSDTNITSEASMQWKGMGTYTAPTGKYDVTIDLLTGKVTIDNVKHGDVNGKLMLGVGSRTTFCNPLAPEMADPSLCRGDDGNFYIYATGGRLFTTSDFQSCHYEGNKVSISQEVFNYCKAGMQSEGKSGDPALWAPDITRVGKNKYLMIYSGSYWGGESHSAIGVAEAENPMGPWTHHPMILNSETSGVHNSIDAQFFIDDDGSKFLVWGSFNGIYVIPLNDEGTAAKYGDSGKDSKVKIAGTSFEGSYIFKRNGYYYYIGSIGKCCEPQVGGRLDDHPYSLIVARSKSIYGPYVEENGLAIMDCNEGTWYQDGRHKIFLGNGNRFVAPGHNGEVFTDDEGKDWIAYHAWDLTDVSQRKLLIDRVVWENGWPRVRWMDPNTSTYIYATPSETPIEGPVFYNTKNGIELNAAGGNTFTASNVEIAATEGTNLVRVMEVQPSKWATEWNMFNTNYGAKKLATACLTYGDEQPMTVSGSESSFYAAKGNYDVTVKLGATPTIKFNNNSSISYPEGLYMIGQVNGTTGWNVTKEQPVKMINNGNGKYATSIYVNGKTEWSFLDVKSNNWGVINAHRYGGNERTLWLSEEQLDGQHAIACKPDITNAQNCYIIPEGTEEGVYHIVVDLANETMTVQKDNDSVRPAGLYLFHSTSVTGGEGAKWNNIDACHALTQTSNGIYTAKSVPLSVEHPGSKTRSFFLLSAVMDPRGQWSGNMWKYVYGPSSCVDDGNHNNAYFTGSTSIRKCEHFFQTETGVYDITANLNTGTLTLTPSAEYPENLYVTGNVNLGKRERNGNERNRLYNAGNGKYYGMINVNDNEDGTFILTATDSDDAEIVDCNLYAAAAPNTTIAMNETKPLYIINRWHSEDPESGNDPQRSDFSFKAPKGRNFVEIDLANKSIKLTDTPRVLYMVRSKGSGEESPNGMSWMTCGNEGVLLRVDGSDCDFVSNGLINFPGENGGNNCYYSFAGVPVPVGVTSGWNIIKLYRLGKENNYQAGTWPDKVHTDFYAGNENYRNTSKGYYKVHANLAAGTFLTVANENNYEGFKIYPVNVQGNFEAFNGIGGTMFTKYDNDTYYIDLGKAPQNTSRRFVIEKDGKYFLNANVASGTQSVTNQWQTAKIGDKNAKGIFTVDSNNYYGLVLKRNGADWQVSALTDNTQVASTKQQPIMRSKDDTVAPYIVTQPEHISWTNPAGSKSVKVHLYNANGTLNKTIDATGKSSLDLYGLYASGFSGYAIVENTYGDANLRQYNRQNISGTADVLNPEYYKAEGTLETVHFEKWLSYDKVTNIYATDLSWDYETSPNVLPSYYTIRMRDDVTGTIYMPAISPVAVGSDGERIEGGNRTSLDCNSDTYRAILFDEVNSLGSENGKNKITYILRPKYLVYNPATITTEINLSTPVTKNARLRAIPNPDELKNVVNISGEDMEVSLEIDADQQPTSVDILADDNIAIVGGVGFISVQGENVQTVDIVSVNGSKVYSSVGSGTAYLESGIYVVCVNGKKPIKVIVK